MKKAFIIFLIALVVFGGLLIYKSQQTTKEESEKQGEIKIEEREEKSQETKLNPTEIKLSSDLVILGEFAPQMTYPKTWKKDIVGYKPHNVFDDAADVKTKIEETFSSEESFMNFDPSTLSENVDARFMLQVKLGQDMIKNGASFDDVAMHYRGYYPRVRLEDENVDAINTLSMKNLQPFEMLIREDQQKEFEDKMYKFQVALTQILREQNYRYQGTGSADGFIVEFFPIYENAALPNGEQVPDGYLYVLVDSAYIVDNEIIGIFQSKGFITE